MANLRKMALVMGLALAIAAMAAPAQASYFDFSDPTNSTLYNGQTSFTLAGILPGIDMVVSAYTIKWTGQVGSSPYNILNSGTMYYDHWRSAGDWGLGINGIYPGTGAYEVGVTEMLDISFINSLTSAPENVMLQSVDLALFFANESQGGVTYNETGWYDFNMAGNFQMMEANQTIYNPATDGKYTLSPNTVISSLQLIGGLGNPAADERKSEYKVQGVAVDSDSAVPEPASMLLFGSAFGLAAVIRKKWAGRA